MAGDNPATPAQVARVMLFRRPLGIDELIAEVHPGPLVWSDPTQTAGGNKVKS